MRYPVCRFILETQFFGDTAKKPQINIYSEITNRCMKSPKNRRKTCSEIKMVRRIGRGSFNHRTLLHHCTPHLLTPAPPHLLTPHLRTPSTQHYIYRVGRFYSKEEDVFIISSHQFTTIVVATPISM